MSDKRAQTGRLLFLLAVVLLLGGCRQPEQTEGIEGTGVVVSAGRIERLTLEQAESHAAEGRIAEGTEEVAENEPETTVEKPEFLMEDVTYFAFDTLTGAQQQWYRQIETCLGEMDEQVRLDLEMLHDGVEEEDIDFLFQCVMLDHPELFFVDGYSYTKYSRGEEIVAIEFDGTYNVTVAEARRKKSEIDREAEKLLEGAEGCATDYERAKYVYETIIRNTDYDMGAEDNQNIYSVFVNHASVCQGYAKATQYLLNRMGMECTLIQGRVDTGEAHSWNLLRADNAYYYMDTTWGDASYQMEEGDAPAESRPDINYDYLCVTTERLLRTHTLESVVPVPECVDTYDNYYVREDAWFESYDEEQMRQLFERQEAPGQFMVALMCADRECFHDIFTALVEKQEIFRYLSADYGSITYSSNEKQLTMSFWVTND